MTKCRYNPKRIPYCPGCVIELVYETTRYDATSLAPSATPRTPRTSMFLNGPVNQLSIKNKIPTDLGLTEPIGTTLTGRTTTEIQRLLDTLSPDIEQVVQSGHPLNARATEDLIRKHLTSPTNVNNTQQYIAHNVGMLVQGVGELKLQGNVLEQLAHKMIGMQQQALDRLALIKSKTEAILTQNYELLEYTIPRLFIVLPETSTSWDPATMFRTKFRLHFICECGEHTKAAGSDIPHHLHLAKHEGYVVNKPREFFQKYGPFLMLMLKMIKTGASVAGIVVPALTSLKVVDILDSTQSYIDSVTSKVINGVDYSLKYLEENRRVVQNLDDINVDGNAKALEDDLDNYLAGVEGLEGVDLRQLGSFLTASSSDNLLGNLYRMTTDKGHVKWVCIDHYRSTYKKNDQETFEHVVQMNGGFYGPQLGQVIIKLGSRIRAKEFFNSLAKARSVDDLDITFDWECTRSDLKVLEDALKKSRVSVLRFDFQQFRESFSSKILSTSAQYEALFRIMELPNMKVIHIVIPKAFIAFFNLQPKKPSRLHKLSFEMEIGNRGNARILAEMLKTNSALVTLYSGSIGSNRAQVLTGARKTNSTLTNLDLSFHKIGSNGAQALSEALKTNSTLVDLNFGFNNIGDDGAQALSEALKTNLTLAYLDLDGNKIGDGGAQALSEALKTNPTLSNLRLGRSNIGGDGAQALSEALRVNSTLTTLNLQLSKIGDSGALALSEALKTNSTLTDLDLWKNKIGDNGAQALSRALKTNSTLTNLNLSTNKIADSGAQALSEALKSNSTLTKLNLHYNNIGSNGAEALSEALKTNSTLTNLKLDENNIGSSGAQALSEALKTNLALTNLDLVENNIGSEGAQALSEALKVNLALTNLRVGFNGIEDNGVQALSEALKANSTLVDLNLGGNKIGNNGAHVLSEALKTNSTLTDLSLEFNNIGNSGAQALSEALKTNLVLINLNLEFNNIGDNGAQALSEALKTNSALADLKLKNNNIGDDGNRALYEAYKKRRDPRQRNLYTF
ncbi:hypothetical protein BGX20_002236 [Mortierella sp. AD010]|nr:hypothetical protein BGX20_002236 [Mortierella sp. AD010]